MGWQMKNGYWAFGSKDKVDGKRTNANNGMTYHYIRVLTERQMEMEDELSKLRDKWNRLWMVFIIISAIEVIKWFV